MTLEDARQVEIHRLQTWLSLLRKAAAEYHEAMIGPYAKTEEEHLEWLARADDAENKLMAALDSAPCYICSSPVAPGEGWRNDEGSWCLLHRPIWAS